MLRILQGISDKELMGLIFVIRDPEAGSNPIAPPAAQKFAYFLPAFSTHTKGTHIQLCGPSKKGMKYDASFRGRKSCEARNE
jgi:hypothetical protein